MRHLVVALWLAACSSTPPPAQPLPPLVGPVTPVATPVPVAPPKPTIDDRRKQLTDLLAEQWEDTLQREPELATLIGDHRFDDRWRDLSAEARAAHLVKAKQFLDRFAAIDATGFREQELLNLALMKRDLQDELEGARFESWLMPIDQMSGPHLQLPQFVSSIRFANVEDYDHYITRLEHIPEVLDQTIALMRSGLAKGLMPPKDQLVLAAAQTLALATGKKSPFAQPIEHFPATVSEHDQMRLAPRVNAAIADKIVPAYKKLAAFLKDEYAPKGRTDPGLWALPDGAARYAFAIRQTTTLDMAPDAIHELGLSEVKRIEGEQEAIGKKLGFPTLAAFRKHVREDKKLYATSQADILARYQKYIDQMYEQLPKLFGRLPAGKLEVFPTEGFREKDAAGADYQPGAPDGSRAGRIRVNTYQPTKRLWIDMESTAYHEGIPGHHLQLTIQQELPELPPFRRFGGYTSYVEGWALYSEALGKEVGFYQDPYSDYGRLQDEMLRAIRLVVDTGLHAKKWTRAQVVTFFHDHSTIDEPSVQAETNRYIVWPGQALAYKLGQLTITRLREKAKAAQGDHFDIRAFHDFILHSGALPLGVLEERFDAWLQLTK